MRLLGGFYSRKLFGRGRGIKNPQSKWAAKLAGEFGNPNLLQLGDTQITDVGLKEVAKMKQLDLLFLQFTKVTKAGVAELRKALPNYTITHNAE